jgi:hypothetical protein
MNVQKQRVHALISITEEHENQLIRVLSAEYIKRIFENRYTLHPRRLREIGEEDIKNFVRFLGSLDRAVSTELGRKRAREGLSHGVVISVGTILRINTPTNFCPSLSSILTPTTMACSKDT